MSLKLISNLLAGDRRMLSDSWVPLLVLDGVTLLLESSIVCRRLSCRYCALFLFLKYVPLYIYCVLYLEHVQNCQPENKQLPRRRKNPQQTTQRLQSWFDNVELSGLKPLGSLRSDVDPPRPAPNTIHMRYESGQGKI